MKWILNGCNTNVLLSFWINNIKRNQHQLAECPKYAGRWIITFDMCPKNWQNSITFEMVVKFSLYQKQNEM